jgi:hypothetical protein
MKEQDSYNKYLSKNNFLSTALIRPLPATVLRGGIFLFFFFWALFFFQEIDQVLKGFPFLFVLLFVPGLAPVLKMLYKEIHYNEANKDDEDHFDRECPANMHPARMPTAFFILELN